MRKISRFICLPVMAVCLLGSFIAHCEAAVQIKGKALTDRGHRCRSYRIRVFGGSEAFIAAV